MNELPATVDGGPAMPPFVLTSRVMTVSGDATALPVPASTPRSTDGPSVRWVHGVMRRLRTVAIACDASLARRTRIFPPRMAPRETIGREVWALQQVVAQMRSELLELQEREVGTGHPADRDGAEKRPSAHRD